LNAGRFAPQYQQRQLKFQVCDPIQQSRRPNGPRW
jgi:hypothetical protein